MKKCALLLLMVLGISTTAWGSSFACVEVSPDCPSCEDDITICVSGCVPGDCAIDDVEVCVKGSIIYMDIYMCCDCDCEPPYSTKFDVCEDIGSLCPGAYAVIAQVHCAGCDCDPCSGPCRPGVCALGSAFFRVCCDDPCGPWYPPCGPCL